MIVADDTIVVGTVNFDAWALYRNFEIALMARDPTTAALLEDRLFTPDIARSNPGKPLGGLLPWLSGWLWDKLAYFI